MFKWVAGLCVAIYLTLLIVGAPPEGVEPSPKDVASAPAAEDPVAEEAEVADTAVQTQPVIEAETTASKAAQEALPETIAPLNPTPIVSVSLDEDASTIDDTNNADSVTLSVQQPVVTESVETATTAVEDVPEPGVGEIWTVTGSRVNLRTAATTEASVVGQTVRGESAEVMELLGNGWAKVYILESGIEAFMSADFIAREG